MERANRVMSQLAPSVTAASTSPPKAQLNGNDIVIVSALRTPLQPARRGLYKDSLIADLLIPVVKETLSRTKIDPAALGDVVTGVVLGDGSFTHTMIRAATLTAGIPYTVPVQTIGRQCGSGVAAVQCIADAITAGQYEMGLALGVESMSSAKFKWGKGDVAPVLLTCPAALDCLIPMGVTAENLADKHGITRAEMDAFATESHRRADQAQKAGHFKAEIVPITVTVKDKEGKEQKVVVSEDGGIRANTTVETLGKLRTVFKKDGKVTAGTSSQVTDGAAAVLLCKRSYAQSQGLPILACVRSTVAVGCPPATMGEGAMLAITPALKKAGLTVPDVDMFEANAAFAPVPILAIKKLGLNPDRVNVVGDAISFGHPLGCTGVRMITTMVHGLRRTGGDYGCVSACCGAGFGVGAVLSRE